MTWPLTCPVSQDGTFSADRVSQVRFGREPKDTAQEPRASNPGASINSHLPAPSDATVAVGAAAAQRTSVVEASESSDIGLLYSESPTAASDAGPGESTIRKQVSIRANVALFHSIRAAVRDCST